MPWMRSTLPRLSRRAVAEFITTEKPGKPIHKVTAFKVVALSALPLSG